MPGFLRVVTLEEAKAKLDRNWRPMPRIVSAPLDEVLDHVLAADVVSKIDVPPFDRAAFDGYAVRASDTFGAGEDSPVDLARVGKLPAGDWPRMKVRDGECIEIATGAPLPKGTDAVVMLEHAVAAGRKVSIYRAVAPGENVAKRGSDIKRGARIARAGKRLTFADVGTLAAAGITRVKVYARPRVAVISSGAELVKAGERLGRGKIYDANGPALCGAARTCGAEPLYLGIARDEASQIRGLVGKGLSDCDVVLFSGGSSTGAGDIAPVVVDGMGRPGVIMHGLAMKPGKPTFVAVVRGKPVFGLPGYPVSALMIFEQLVAPYLRRLSGMREVGPAKIRAKLASKILSVRGRRELVPVKLTRRGREVYAQPLLKGSGAVTSLSLADGYVDVPLEREIVEEGESVVVNLFGGGEVG